MINDNTFKNLEDIHPHIRKQTIKSLADSGDKTVIPKLIEILLNDQASSVRQAVAQAFQKGLVDKCTIPALIKALKDPEETVRGAAAAALGSIKDRTTVPNLCEALKDASEHVRCSAIYSLAKIGDKTAIGALEELISNLEESSNLKAIAKETLRQLKIN
jgi:HEAT repeat protein